MKKGMVLCSTMTLLALAGCASMQPGTGSANSANKQENVTTNASDAGTNSMTNSSGNSGSSNSVDQIPSPSPNPIATAYIVQNSLKDKINNIIYPQIVGLPNASVQAKINGDLKPTSLPSASDNSGSEQDPPHTYSADYSVLYRQGDIMDILSNSYYMPTGAAHGMPSRESLIINLKTGTVYSLKDLFRPGSNYLQVISDVIRKEDTQHELAVGGTFTGVTNSDGFYLTSDGIVVFFQPYEWTGYAVGFPTFHVSYSRMSSVLDKSSNFWAALTDSAVSNTNAIRAADLQKVDSLGFTVDDFSATETPTDNGDVLFAFNAVQKNDKTGMKHKVFFFLNNRYLGTDTSRTHGYSDGLKPVNRGTIAATYYEGDSNQSFTIQYHWNGSSLVPSPNFPSDYKDWY